MKKAQMKADKLIDLDFNVAVSQQLLPYVSLSNRDACR